MNQSKQTHLQGYEYFTDGETGELLATQRSTGEISEAHYILAPAGSRIITPEEQKAYREQKERERKNALLKQMRISESTRQGNRFFFINGWNDFRNLKPQTVARLVYLQTFLGYGKKTLMLLQRTPMRYVDLSEVLGLSPATVNRFWEEVSPQYLTADADGVISVCGDTFVRGKIKHGDEYDYRKVFTNGIRQMYKTISIEKHRILGQVFQMLPYINIEYNILCWNPQETDINEIQLLSASQFCELIGFDVTHISELAKLYNSLTFQRNGKQERFCAFIYDGINKEDAKICINPRILYSGTNSEKVEVLGLLCAE